MTARPPLSQLLAADPNDPGCDATVEILDIYVDLALDGQDAAARFPGVAAHLRSCPGCRQDFEGLRAAANS